MIALTRMRLAGFLRGGRALPPLLAALVVLGTVYGGGEAPAGEAYGFSAVVLFPVLAWQTKLLLDAEPDLQRRIARVAAGPRAEAAAGLLAATVAGLVTGVLAVALPWLTGGIRGPLPGTTEPPLAIGVVCGVWAHLLALAAAVALGAVASRAVTGTVLRGVAVLVTGAVLGVVLSLRGSAAPWLAPPLMTVARGLHDRIGATDVLTLTAHALGWTAVVLAVYGGLRRSRA